MNKRDDCIYKALKERYIEACEMINNLSKFQAADRKALKSEEDPIRRRSIRHRLASRRGGKNGLRKLNKDIARFYSYCQEMGY